jgi:replicative DNA helicase
MELDLTVTKLTRVKDITIPDIFNRRIKTGIKTIDALFDEGILPGSAATLTAKAGCGKTTFMLQLLEGLSKNGYKVGYFSGEESIYQLAYTATRVNAKEVPIANLTDIDDISEQMKELDVVIIDSFQALTTKTKMNSRQLEKYAVQHLTQVAKATECSVMFIMHLTKSGDLKGGTIVPHTVDANLKIDRVADVDDDGARVIYFEKNRFGPLNELECIIGRNGYDFDAKVIREEDEPVKAKSKAQRKLDDHNRLIGHMRENGSITIPTAAKLVDNNVSRAYSLLRELVTLDQAEKHGRGQGGYWTAAEADWHANERNETTVLRFAAESTK